MKENNSEIIHNYRNRLDLTQAELGKKLGVDQSQVSRWESGKSRVPIAVIKLLRYI